MLAKIGDSVINTEDIQSAQMDMDKNIKVRFRDGSILVIASQRPEEDLKQLERVSVPR